LNQWRSYRVPCSLGQEIFLRRQSTKTTEFEVKIGAKCGRIKNRTFTVVILFFFEGNKTYLALEMNFDNVVIVGGSNNAGVLERSPQPPEANGGFEQDPPMLRRYFTVFYFQKYAFLTYFSLNFCLKRVLNDCKKGAVASPRPAPWGACLHFPPTPLATPLN